jgi:YaiO family outer membrane protein
LKHLASVVTFIGLTLSSPSLSVAFQTKGWSFDIGVERSDVEIDEDDAVWGRERAQVGYRDPAKGGLFLAFERHTRDGLTDAVMIAGGYRRLGDWTVFGRVGFTPKADFYFRQAIEAEVSRRAVGTLVVHMGYRYLNFPAGEVHVLTPAATYYFAKGDVHGRAFLVNNPTLDVGSSSFLFRGNYQVRPRIRMSGGVAFGERIFDVTSLPNEPAEGWLVYLEPLFGITEKDAIGFQVGLAHEEPYFDRWTLGFFYRRTF